MESGGTVISETKKMTGLSREAKGTRRDTICCGLWLLRLLLLLFSFVSLLFRYFGFVPFSRLRPAGCFGIFFFITSTAFLLPSADRNSSSFSFVRSFFVLFCFSFCLFFFFCFDCVVPHQLYLWRFPLPLRNNQRN